MEMNESDTDTSVALAHEMVHALHSDRLDEAEQKLNELLESCDLPPTDADLLVFHVAIAIQRGRVHDALCELNNLDEEDLRPELRAICLYLVGDPLWHGVASTVAETTGDEHVRLAMRQLLGQAGDEP
jgi:type III secretion protein HrpB1